MNSRIPYCRSRDSKLLSCLRNLCAGDGLFGKLLAFAAIWIAVTFGGKAMAQNTVTNCLTVICPPDLTNYVCSDVFTPTGYPIIVSNDCPGLQFQINCQPPPGTPLGLGVHPVHCVVTAGGVVAAVCDFKITVIQDTQPPQIHCPQNAIVAHGCPNAAGGCGAVVNYPLPPAIDNSGLVGVACVPPPGSYFPCGTTIVTCTATDRCDNKTSCQFPVTVLDDGHPPVITCPQDLTIQTCSNVAVLHYPPPSVTPAGTPVICTPPPGTLLPPGTHTVTCVASNNCGSDQCSFTVSIIQGHPPVLPCPTAPITAVIPCGTNCVPVNYTVPTLADGTVAVCNPPSGTCLPLGNHPVVCVVSNECGQATCQFVIQVSQGQGNPPAIDCPQDILVTTCSNCAPVVYPTPIVSNGVLVGCHPPPGACFPLGVTTVHCLATNLCGARECSFTVTVRPVPPPVIECPTNPIVVVAPCTSNCVPVFYPMPIVTGGVLVGCTPPQGTCLPVGLHPVTCYAKNDCGEQASCSFEIRVIQGQGNPPSIDCPQDIVVNTCSNCAPVSYPAPIVANGALVGCVPPSGSCFPLGVSTVHCLATNACGSRECSFTVTVRPVPPPTIECPTNPIVVVAPCTSNCVPVFYPMPTASSGAIVACNLPSGSCLPVGLHVITCEARNQCGEKANCQFEIRVIQGQGNPPSIDCPQDIVVNTCSNCAPVSYPAPIVVNGALAGCTPPSGFCFPLGVTTVTCLATNACGGSATCSFSVVVRPVPPPSIQCPTNPIVVVAPCNSNCVPVFYPMPTVTSGTLVACTPPSGTCLPVGLHLVTCYAKNDCGEQVGCEFNVRVIQGQGNPPAIDCPQGILVNTCSNCAPVTYPAPAVVNGTLVGCMPPSGSCFPIGVTTVTCVATNDCGSADCKFTVVVRPVPPVHITCPSNIVVTTLGQGEIVSYPPPTVTGGSATVVPVCVPPSGSFFPLGTNVVTCCVTDICDRVECCSFTITVAPCGPCVKPPANMVLWLPFDEPVGPIANNIIPGAPNGQHINGPVPLLGQKVLNSLAFDGVNDFVRVPNYAAIQLSTSDLTIDAWILRRDNVAAAGRRVIVSKLGQLAGALGVRGYEFYLNNGVMNLALGGAVAQNFNSGIVVPLDNNWHHVAVTVRRSLGGTVTFYLDGVPVNAQPGPITLPLANNARLHVGAGTWPGPNGFFRGYIDEVEIFNRALAPAEIFALWRADRFGKCKIRVRVPWNVSFPAGVNCMTVPAQVCNYTAVPQPATWTATGPMTITPPSGTVVIPPFTCINIPLTVCRPGTNFPAGAVVPWTFALQPVDGCPIITRGSVINPGPIIIVLPDVPIGIVGTNRIGNVRIGLNGLPPGVPLRLRAIGPDMEPDLSTISLNGLPPGTPVIVGGSKSANTAKDGGGVDVSVRFSESNPSDTYTILVEADLDDDGNFDSLGSFDVANPVVTPPDLKIVPGPTGPVFDWSDEGVGQLEESESPDGPWTAIEGSRPGHPVNIGGPKKFYRVTTPAE